MGFTQEGTINSNFSSGQLLRLPAGDASTSSDASSGIYLPGGEFLVAVSEASDGRHPSLSRFSSDGLQDFSYGQNGKFSLVEGGFSGTDVRFIEFISAR